ncbi:unnamed protein product, partial [Brenthis ino]
MPFSREGFYAKLENANNDKQLFKIAKQRHRDTQDTRAVKYIKDLQGNLLTSDSDINDRWREYYAKLLNETHPCEPIMELPTVKGPWPVITPEEVKLALSQKAKWLIIRQLVLMICQRSCGRNWETMECTF